MNLIELYHLTVKVIYPEGHESQVIKKASSEALKYSRSIHMSWIQDSSHRAPFNSKLTVDLINEELARRVRKSFSGKKKRNSWLQK